jgi:hypothetical protein
MLMLCRGRSLLWEGFTVPILETGQAIGDNYSLLKEDISGVDIQPGEWLVFEEELARVVEPMMPRIVRVLHARIDGSSSPDPSTFCSSFGKVPRDDEGSRDWAAQGIIATCIEYGGDSCGAGLKFLLLFVIWHHLRYFVLEA